MTGRAAATGPPRTALPGVCFLSQSCCWGGRLFSRGRGSQGCPGSITAYVRQHLPCETPLSVRGCPEPRPAELGPGTEEGRPAAPDSPGPARRVIARATSWMRRREATLRKRRPHRRRYVGRAVVGVDGPFLGSRPGVHRPVAQCCRFRSQAQRTQNPEEERKGPREPGAIKGGKS